MRVFAALQIASETSAVSPAPAVDPASSPRPLQRSDSDLPGPRWRDFSRVPLHARVVGSPGRPLDRAGRAPMERAFERDLSDERVHTDAAAAASASAIHAQAYAYGDHIVFGEGRYAPATPAGRRLLAHELTHVLQQRRSGSAPIVQCQTDRDKLTARLQEVRAQLARLRAEEERFSKKSAGDATAEAEQRSGERVQEELKAKAQSELRERKLNLPAGGDKLRRAVKTSRSGDTVTLSASFRIKYLALPDKQARERAATDIPRVETAIRDAWQVKITSGVYAGIEFRMSPKVTYVPSNEPLSGDAFTIEVKAPSTGAGKDASVGYPEIGVISLLPQHLEGQRIVVVAHELMHLFGWIDAYYITPPPQGPRPAVGATTLSVGRPDRANRPDLLGLVDPELLKRYEQKLSPEQVARQRRPVHIWEEDATTVLELLRVAPPDPKRPGPDSPKFDPADELARRQREGDARVRQIEERTRKYEEVAESTKRVEEILRLENEERELTQRLAASPARP